MGKLRTAGRRLLGSRPVRFALKRSPYVASHYMRGILWLRNERSSTGGSATARYCYSVWLRHLYVLRKNVPGFRPRSVLEYGPGDSLGVGLAALVCGAEHYTALDAHRYATTERNLRVFDELVEYFKSRAPIPHGDDLVEVKPAIASYEFPGAFLSDLDVLLQPQRLEKARNVIAALDSGRPTNGDFCVRYTVPWDGTTQLGKALFDFAMSQATLEHVADPEAAYTSMGQWVMPGGYISHQIDFRSHGTSFDWNGHWQYDEDQWARVRNPQVYRSINRLPFSHHIRLIEKNGFAIVSIIAVRQPVTLTRKDVAPQWRDLSEEDLTTSGAHILARKL